MSSAFLFSSNRKLPKSKPSKFLEISAGYLSPLKATTVSSSSSQKDFTLKASGIESHSSSVGLSSVGVSSVGLSLTSILSVLLDVVLLLFLTTTITSINTSSIIIIDIIPINKIILLSILFI